MTKLTLLCHGGGLRCAGGGAQQQAALRWLTLSQYALIEPLAEGGERRVNELAEAAGITGPTATRILDVLERRGIVRRTPSEADKRAVAVGLTRDGRRLFEAQYAWRRERERALYDGLPPRQRAMVAEVLTRLSGLIDELAPGPPGDSGPPGKSG